MKKILTMTALVTITTASFGAASLKAPQRIGNTATVTAPSTTARAGTLRVQPAQTVSTATPAAVATGSVSSGPMVTDSRMAGVKGLKNIGSIKNTNKANQELANLNSRIEELQSKLDTAEAIQKTVVTTSDIETQIAEKIEDMGISTTDKTYSKTEVDNLLAELEKKLPKIDDKGNMTWTDPNGNLAVIHIGDVVIGGDDTIIIDGNLSTTSTHPVQNQVVTNALNEKQDRSTHLSFGNANGGWTHVANGSDYIELYTNPANSKGFRIKPTMITNNLDNIENEDQLITAGAVRDALNALATNSGNGTQQEPYFNLINLETRHGGLVQRYTYETNAPESEIVNFALNSCGGAFSDRWCALYENDGHIFKIVKRQTGHVLEDTTSLINHDTGNVYLNLTYAVNLPNGVTPQTYVNEHLCTSRTNTCSMSYVWYSGTDGFNFNNTLEPLYFIGINVE